LHDTPTTPVRPPLARFTDVVFRIGNSTFGGGYITIVMLGRDFVDRRKWLSAEEYDLAFSLARVTPGTNIVAFCAAIGWLVKRWSGAIAAVLAITVPSAAIAVVLMQSIESWRSQPWVTAALGATVAAVTGMMWATVWMLAKPHVGGWTKSIRAIAILGGSCGAAWLGVNPLPIILAATAIGFLWTDGGGK
jgi:chromate transporter